MERTAGTGFYRTQHEEFMMEKSTIMEYVLLQQQLKEKRGGGGGSGVGVVFLDCDITTLAPLPELLSSPPSSSSSASNTTAIPPSLAVSRHYISQRDELMFGTYNGGMVYMSDPSLLPVWRRCTMDPSNRFFDQSSLEGVVDEVMLSCGSSTNNSDLVRGGDGASTTTDTSNNSRHSCQLFPLQSNFGYWRLLQQGTEGQPLASIPPPPPHTTPPTNRSPSRRHARMMAKYGHNGASLADLASSTSIEGMDVSSHTLGDGGGGNGGTADVDAYGVDGEESLYSVKTVLKRFSIQVPSSLSSSNHALVHFDNMPLQSVHTHLLVRPTSGGGGANKDNVKMILFNRFIIGMMRRAVGVGGGGSGCGGTSSPPHPYARLLEIIDNTTTTS